MSLEETVAALTRRVDRLEDELAIHRLIVRYGLAVDTGDADRSAEVFTEDGVDDVDVGRMEGREAVRAMVRSSRHGEMVGHCAHQIGPAVVTFGDATHAVAVGYSRVYLATRAGTPDVLGKVSVGLDRALQTFGADVVFALSFVPENGEQPGRGACRVQCRTGTGAAQIQSQNVDRRGIHSRIQRDRVSTHRVDAHAGRRGWHAGRIPFCRIEPRTIYAT